MTRSDRKYRGGNPSRYGERADQAQKRIEREVESGVRCKRCTLLNPCECFDIEAYARARKEVFNNG